MIKLTVGDTVVVQQDRAFNRGDAPEAMTGRRGKVVGVEPGAQARVEFTEAFPQGSTFRLTFPAQDLHVIERGVGARQVVEVEGTPSILIELHKLLTTQGLSPCHLDSLRVLEVEVEPHRLGEVVVAVQTAQHGRNGRCKVSMVVR